MIQKIIREINNQDKHIMKNISFLIKTKMILIIELAIQKVNGTAIHNGLTGTPAQTLTLCGSDDHKY